MIDVEEFEAVFPAGVGYTKGLIDDIQENQSMLGGRTFFERLLELLQIKGGRKFYPPKSDEQFHELHKRIVSAPINLHFKHCLIFYLLKDLSPSYHETELASTFARDVHLEKRFWTFVEGLWELDHLQYETAVGNLTHPSIIPTFPDEIMLTLLTRRYPSDHVDLGDVLPLAYYNCVKPPLTGEKVKKQFVEYMAGRNITETYYWIRGRPEYEQKPLLEILVSEALNNNTWHISEDKEAYPREEKAMEFVSLPFDEEEEEWLEKYLTEGKGRTFRGAEDTVMIRRIATGRLQDVARDAGARGRKFEGVNWEILKDGVKHGLGPRKDEEAFKV